MIRRIASPLVLGLCLIATQAQADDASHMAAVQELFKVMHMDETMAKSIDAMLDQQVKQNPLIGRFRGDVGLFAEAHELAEHRAGDGQDLHAGVHGSRDQGNHHLLQDSARTEGHHQDPGHDGQAEIGQARVQQNMAELQKMIADEEAKQKQ